jgi:hypothetical protein
MATLKHRVDSREALLGEFIVHTDVALNRLERAIQELKEELAKDREEAAKAREEAARERKEMNRKWGELANKMGTLVEDIVAPNLTKIAQKYFGFEEIDFFAIRIYKRNSKNRAIRREFDAVVVCEDKVIINDTKSTPKINSIKDFIEVLKEIYGYFPEYRDKKIIPIFSSLYIPDETVKYLTKNRIYAMAMKEDTMDLLNFDLVNHPA